MSHSAEVIYVHRGDIGITGVRVADPFGDNRVTAIRLLTDNGWIREAEEHHGCLVDSSKTLLLREVDGKLVIRSPERCLIRIERRGRSTMEIRLLPG